MDICILVTIVFVFVFALLLSYILGRKDAAEVTVERTGRIYSFASVEYVAKFPNDDRVLIWSPPWADDETPEEKDGKALEYARHVWLNKDYAPVGRAKARTEFTKFFSEGDELEAFLDKQTSDSNRLQNIFEVYRWAANSKWRCLTTASSGSMRLPPPRRPSSHFWTTGNSMR